MVERMLVCLLARGHCLIEGVPGLAKTLAVETLASTVGGTFAPHPVHARPRAVRHRRHAHLPAVDARRSTSSSGPVFANFVLADEINRAPAKVQSALLEVMAEGHVSIGGITHRVPAAVPRARDAEPDRVGGRLPAPRGAARPLPHEDRRRLPERRRGGRDRPSHGRRPARAPTGARRRKRSCDLQRDADQVFVHHAVIDYAVRLVLTTRDPRRYGPPETSRRYIAYGASPRASLGLVAAGRALALIRGRDYVLPAGRVRRRARGAAASARAVVRGTGRRRRRRRHRGTGARHGRDAEGGAAPVRRVVERGRGGGGGRGDRRANVRRDLCSDVRARPDGIRAAAPRAARSPRASTGCSRATTSGSVPAPGTEPGEGREYVAGDDVRRIDWNLTARTNVTHVRDTIADRELETWIVVDRSASLDFGTARVREARPRARRGGRGRVPHRARRQPHRRRRARGRAQLPSPGALPGATRCWRSSTGSTGSRRRRPRRRERRGAVRRRRWPGSPRSRATRGLVVIVSDFLATRRVGPAHPRAHCSPRRARGRGHRPARARAARRRRPRRSSTPRPVGGSRCRRRA